MVLTRQNKDSQSNPEEEYTALLRSLRWTEGFGLLFVQCSPAEGSRIIDQVRQDLPQKQVEVLSIKDPIENLYDLVDALPNKDDIDVLFIQGIEHSLYDYEKTQLWENPSDHYTYSEKNVPRLLGHLNLSRERFRDHFKICFVFLVPLFALKYLVRRAPDFFDWRSGVLRFRTDPQTVAQESLKLYGDYKEYLTWTQAERNNRILDIQNYLEELDQTRDKASLLLQQGNVFTASNEYKEAIASYDEALKHKPNQDAAWYNRGFALGNLERYEEAIASYDEALKHKPNQDAAWYNRGIALGNLERYEEAIASYDEALKHKPNQDAAWYNRGIALRNLERYEEAIASYDEALKINPNDANTFYNKACCYGLQGQVELAIATLKQAIDLNPKYREMAKTDAAFDRVRGDGCSAVPEG